MVIIKGINVFPDAIGEVISRVRDVLTSEYQIVLDTPPPYDDLCVEVECRSGCDSSALEAVAIRLSQDIREQLEFTARIVIVPKGSIKQRGEKAKRIRREYS